MSESVRRSPVMIPLEWEHLEVPEQLRRAQEFERLMRRRRSVRAFSERAVPIELVESAIRTAGLAPSGANKQPWKFVLVDDPAIKREIRLAAEAEERKNYEHRMSPEWLKDLEPFGTDWHKEFLERAPVLIVVFKERFALKDGRAEKHYYVEESVGIACGFLIVALHQAGLACLTHTPSPMNFLGRILARPSNEVPYLLMPVGYPDPGATVPSIQRKPQDVLLVRNRGDRPSSS
jgi:iodotyrosine deiodinase